MATPVDAGRATTNSTTSGTSHSVNLPGSIAAGDILVVVVRTPAAATVSWPAGWTELDEANIDASDDSTAIAYRVADGSEGATITVTLGTARVLVALAYRITGAHASGVAISAATVGSATQPNSPNLTGILTAARNILWLSIGGCDDAETLTSGPTSYANATVQASTATGASGCTVYGATRGLNAASEDPGAWTLGSTSIWTTWTLAFSDAALPIRLSQEPAEILVKPTDHKARVSQLPAEVLVKPTDHKARLSQLPAEILVKPTDRKVRLSQFAVEILVRQQADYVSVSIID